MRMIVTGGAGFIGSHCLQALVLVVTLLPLACAKRLPEVIRVGYDPSFTYENVESGGIGVAGVTSDWFDLPGTSATTDWIGPWLWARIAEERPDLTLVSSQQIADSMGREEYLDLLDSHSRLAELDSTALAKLSTSLSYPRYVVFARIELDTVEIDGRYTEERRTDNDRDCVYTNLELTTERTIEVRFQVYDVELRELVWAGVSRHKKTSQPRTHHVDGSCESDGLVLSVIEVLFSLLADSDSPGKEPPDPPKWSGMLKASFKAFARKLPSGGGPGAP